jgi:calcium-binding protein
MTREIFLDKLSGPEGPVILSDGSFLFVEMAAGIVGHYEPQKKKRKVIAKLSRPNGLAVDKDGVVWCAESQNPPSLLKITMDGKVEIFLDNCNGLPFLFPNDLAFDSDGLLYMTDSGILTKNLFVNGKVRDDYNALPYDGRIYCIDTKTKEIHLVDRGYRFANGLAFGPDGLFYANETRTGNIYRYKRKGNFFDKSTKELFGNVWLDDGKTYLRGPDGMKFSRSGNLYCAVHGQGDICVLSPHGDVKERIFTGGKRPTNVVFGTDTNLYVTEVENGCIEHYELSSDSGFPLYH